MTMLKHQSGFSIIEIAIVILVIGVGGLVGYTAYSRYQDNKSVANTTQLAKQSPVASDIAPAPSITSTTDLTTAAKTLDDTNLDDSTDTSQLDSELSAF